MKTRGAVVTLAWVLAAASLRAQEAAPTPAGATPPPGSSSELGKPFDPTAWWGEVHPSAARDAYRYWVRIRDGLGRVAADHPALAERARALLAKAEERYEPAALLIDLHFGRVHAEWNEDKEDYRQHLEKLGTPKEPEEFFGEVARGLEGNTGGGQGELLLAFSPRYAERPERELEDGITSLLGTRGQTRSSGLELWMTLPRSWAYEDPGRAGPFMSRRSHAGAGEMVMSLIASDVPEDRLKAIMEAGGAKVLANPEVVTSAGGTMVDVGEGTFAKEPSAWTRYLVSEAGEGGAVKVLVWSIHTLHAGKYVNVQFQLASIGTVAGDLAGDEAMKARFEHYRPLLDRIVESATYDAPKAP